jgi:hypothetical protein
MKKLYSSITLFVLLFSGLAFSQPQWAPEICMVTVDSATATYISIIWNKPAATDIDSFYIYRADSNQTNWARIAAIAYEDSSVYDDIAVNVNTIWYAYKINALDTNGVQGAKSLWVSSFLLDVTPDVANGYFTCNWNAYNNPYNTGNLVRCIWDSLGNANSMQQIGSNFSPSLTTWNHTGYSNAAQSIYRVEAEATNSCTPERALINTSRSNLRGVANPTANIKTMEQLLSLVRVFPNPSANFIQLEWNAALGIKKIELTDVRGRTIQTLIPESTLLKKTIELKDVESGIYFVNFYSVKGIVSNRIIKD